MLTMGNHLTKCASQLRLSVRFALKSLAAAWLGL
jgi:hypothetical protein